MEGDFFVSSRERQREIDAVRPDVTELERVPRLAGNDEAAARQEFQGARIPVYKKWVPVRRQVGNGSVYVVGDAAGQVKVTTVGGIVT